MGLNYPKIVTELPGPRSKKLLARDARFVSGSYTRSYPLVIALGRGCMVEDPDGNRFLDCTAGIAVTATGHSHPEVVQAVQGQAACFMHMSGTDFYYETQVALAERLAKLAPGDEPKKVFFCNSGAEAVEGAVKLARCHTGRQNIIAFFGSFHGRTHGALSLSASKAKQRGSFFPLLPGVFHAPYPDPYRCLPGMTTSEYATWCVNWIKENMFERLVPPDTVAAIVVEEIQGEGGYIVPPSNFHRELAKLCAEYGILYIADEVQSGIGRTGTMFASEQFGVTPDIICLAKGMASGLPLGAIVAPARVMDWTPGEHASTFGGNPVACAAALTTLDLVEQELMDNAKLQGEWLMLQLEKLKQKHSLIGQVRGRGLMVAVELVRDRVTKERATTERDAVVQACFERGLLVLGCGTNAVRFSPALTITQEELAIAVDILDKALSSIV